MSGPPEAERQESEAEAGETEERAAGFIVAAASDETIAPGDEDPETERTEGGVATLIVSPSVDGASEAPQSLQTDARSGLAVLQ